MRGSLLTNPFRPAMVLHGGFFDADYTEVDMRVRDDGIDTRTLSAFLCRPIDN